MELVVSLIHPSHRVMFEPLAATGVRRSEALVALRVQDLELNGAHPTVKARQRSRAQKGLGQVVVGPLKSTHARRDLPISTGNRRPTQSTPQPHHGRGARLREPYRAAIRSAHLYNRVLRPACAEAGVEWAGFHTFRHTVASRMFAAGRTAVQVQHWLGHHSAAFTLRTYVHLLDPGDLGGPLEPLRVKQRSRERPETAAKVDGANLTKSALAGFP